MATVGRYIPLLGLGALLPLVAYALGRNDVTVALSVACVFLIVGSLRWMLGGWDEETPTHGH